LPEKIGKIIARQCDENNKSEGNFRDIIEKNFPELFPCLDKHEVKNIEFNYSKVRAEFSNYKLKDNTIYKFTPGRGSKFKKSIKEYSFQNKSPKKSESKLGEMIEKKIEDNLGLTYILHSQNDRKLGKFQNVDFEGFKIVRGIGDDEFHMYNFELKSTNQIPAISEKD